MPSMPGTVRYGIGVSAPPPLPSYSQPDAGSSGTRSRLFCSLAASAVVVAALGMILPAVSGRGRGGRRGPSLITWQLLSITTRRTFDPAWDDETRVIGAVVGLEGLASASLMLAGPWLAVLRLRRPPRPMVRVADVVLLLPLQLTAAAVAQPNSETRVGLWLLSAASVGQYAVLTAAARVPRG